MCINRVQLMRLMVDRCGVCRWMTGEEAWRFMGSVVWGEHGEKHRKADRAVKEKIYTRNIARRKLCSRSTKFQFVLYSHGCLGETIIEDVWFVIWVFWFWELMDGDNVWFKWSEQLCSEYTRPLSNPNDVLNKLLNSTDQVLFIHPQWQFMWWKTKP